jgi:glycosyltransferase involved in cell wall biosynthesis
MAGKFILYVTPALPVGGAEKFLVLLANSLIKNGARQTVVSLSSDNKLQHEFSEEVQFVALPRSAKLDRQPLKTLKNLIREEKPDFIFCLNFFSFFIVKMTILGMRPKPSVIVSYHSTIHENRKEHNLHKIYSRIIGKKDLVITVSENQKNYTSAKYHIAPGRIRTIHNGIDLNRWNLPGDVRNKSLIREQFGIPSDAPVIVMTAAFRPEKNHSDAIRALGLLHSEFQTRAYLLLVGDGILMEQSRELAVKENLKDYIIFTGPQSDVRPFYWAGDLFTLSSSSETFSIAALEAMACGLPAVLTNIGGASEMILTGVNGFLCEPEPHDLAKKWSEALRTKFNQQGIHDHIRDQFNAEKMIGEYRKVLQLQDN